MATDRLIERARAEVEAVRVGTIFAHDGKSYGRWRRSFGERVADGLSGTALEGAVMGLAATHPEYIVVGA